MCVFVFVVEVYRWVLFFGNCEGCYIERLCISFYLNVCFSFLGCIFRRGIVGLYGDFFSVESESMYWGVCMSISVSFFIRVFIFKISIGEV